MFWCHIAYIQAGQSGRHTAERDTLLVRSSASCWHQKMNLWHTVQFWEPHISHTELRQPPKSERIICWSVFHKTSALRIWICSRKQERASWEYKSLNTVNKQPQLRLHCLSILIIYSITRWVLLMYLMVKCVYKYLDTLKLNRLNGK